MNEHDAGDGRFPLSFYFGHMVAAIDGRMWVLDTGSPASFGSQTLLRIAGESVTLASAYMGLDANSLSNLIGGDVAGLLGADVLNRFDVMFDARPDYMQVHCSVKELALEGTSLPLRSVLGVPMVDAEIDGEQHSMFLDTGASISYFQGERLDEQQPMGVVSDFFPGLGSFETETWRLPLRLGGLDFWLRTGQLPGLLGMTLTLAGATGIVGNEVCAGRCVGYFARRARVVLA